MRNFLFNPFGIKFAQSSRFFCLRVFLVRFVSFPLYCFSPLSSRGIDSDYATITLRRVSTPNARLQCHELLMIA